MSKPKIFERLDDIDAELAAIPKQANIIFASDNFNIEAEGEFVDNVGGQDWTVVANGTTSTVEQVEDVGLGRLVILCTDNDSGAPVDLLTSLDTQKWANAYAFGDVFGGVTGGQVGAFFAIAGWSAASDPRPTSSRGRFIFTISDNAGNTRVNVPGTGNVETVIPFGDTFKLECQVEPGFIDNRALINGVDVGPMVVSGSNLGSDNKCFVTSGSSGGTNLIFKVLSFGLTIYTETNTKLLTKEQVEVAKMKIFTATGKRDYFVKFPSNIIALYGRELSIFAANIGGNITFQNEDANTTPKFLFQTLDSIEIPITKLTTASLFNDDAVNNYYKGELE